MSGEREGEGKYGMIVGVTPFRGHNSDSECECEHQTSLVPMRRALSRRHASEPARFAARHIPLPETSEMREISFNKDEGRNCGNSLC